MLAPHTHAAAILAVLAITLLFLVPTPATASALPTHATDGSWAYLENASGSVTADRAGGTVSVTYSILGAVIVNQTNLSDGGYQITFHRGIQVQFQSNYCSPDCTTALSYANLSLSLREALNVVENFTPAASMSAQNASVEAMSLTSGYGTTLYNMTLASQRSVSLSTPGRGGVHFQDSSAYVSLNLAGNFSFTLGSPLGVFPSNLSPGEQVSSSTTFNLQGSASGSYHYYFAPGFNGSAGASQTGVLPTTLLPQTSGTLTVLAEEGASTPVFGQTMASLDLSVHGGPFLFVDGALVPYFLEPLGPGMPYFFHPPDLFGSAVFATQALYLSGPGSSGKFLSSNSGFSADMQIPGNSAGPVSPTSTNVAQANVTGQPTSVDNAWQVYQTVAPTGQTVVSTGTSLSNVWILLAVAGAAFVVAGAVVAGTQGKPRGPKPPTPPGPSLFAAAAIPPPEESNHPVENIW